MNRALIIGILITTMITIMILTYYLYTPDDKPDDALPKYVPPPITPTVYQPDTEPPPTSSPTSTTLPTSSPTSTTAPPSTDTPTVKSTDVRLFSDADYTGDHLDVTYGLTDLPDKLRNAVTSMQVGSDVVTAIFDKETCDPASWNALITDSTTKLQDKYNNDIACVIVLPKGITNGMIAECNGTRYKIENYRKRKFPSDAVYISHGSPKPTFTNCTAIWKIPDGQDMVLNPDYRPPLQLGNIRLSTAGVYKDLPFGLNNIPAPLTNNVANIELANDTSALLFDKLDCTTGAWNNLYESSSALTDKYKNDAACVIVLPRGVKEGSIVKCQDKTYKIASGRKSLYPTDYIYTSWGRPPVNVTLTCAAINTIPDGPNITENPLYVPRGTVRLFPDQDYTGVYGDYVAGMYTLPDGLRNDVSSVIVGADVSAAVFDKEGCAISSWYLPVKDKMPSLGAIDSKYNNDVACIVVLPYGVNEGDVVTDGITKYLIEHYHKRKFSTYAYDSWKASYPTVKSIAASDLAKIPDSDDVAVNPKYDPPLAKDKFARLYRDADYTGGFVDLGWGMSSVADMKTNLGDTIANQVTSVKVATGAKAILYDKTDCNPNSWSKLVSGLLNTLEGSGHNDDVACVIVVPDVITDGKVFSDGTNTYLIENYRKRFMSPAIYTTWKSKYPTIITVTSDIINIVPLGEPMSANPDYEPPVKANTVRLFPDNGFKGKYIDYTAGMYDLPSGLANDVSSARVRDVDAALFDKVGCDITSWLLPIKGDIDILEKNNDAACLIALPPGVYEGDVVTDGANKYLIEKYHKRKFSDYAYQSWSNKYPTVKSISNSNLILIPSSDDMSVNPTYDPPFAAGMQARLYRGSNFIGGFVDLGWGQTSLVGLKTNLGDNISNQVTSVKTNTGAKAVIYDKDDCSPGSWSQSIVDTLKTLVGTGHDDDVACAIVVPDVIEDGKIFSDGTTIYLIENYHKRKYTADVYASWYNPPIYKTVNTNKLNPVPNGADVPLNPDYVPPPGKNVVRLHANHADADGHYTNPYFDVRYGQTTLPSNMANDVSALQVGDNVDAVLFDKDDCTGWSLLVPNDTPDLGTLGRNNDAACVIVIPKGVRNGNVYRNPVTGAIYLIEDYRKRQYSTPTIYTSWGSPPYTDLDLIDKIPDGTPMALNPLWVPPGMARLYNGRNFSGAYADIGVGQNNLNTIKATDNNYIGNRVSSIKTPNGRLGVYDKDNCDPAYKFTTVSGEVPDMSTLNFNDDLACAILLPPGVLNGAVIHDPTTKILYKIEKHRKRRYPNWDIFLSWGGPSWIDVASNMVNKIPDGDPIEYNTAAPNTTNTNLNSTPTPIELWTDSNFTGKVLKLGKGKFVLSQFTPNVANDIESIKVPAGLRVQVFDKDDFTGNTLVLTSSMSVLDGTGLKNDIASVIISG